MFVCGCFDLWAVSSCVGLEAQLVWFCFCLCAGGCGGVGRGLWRASPALCLCLFVLLSSCSVLVPLFLGFLSFCLWGVVLGCGPFVWGLLFFWCCPVLLFLWTLLVAPHLW